MKWGIKAAMLLAITAGFAMAQQHAVQAAPNSLIGVPTPEQHQLNNDELTPLNGVLTIKYHPGYGIAVWDTPLEGRKVATPHKLMTGTHWRYSAIYVDYVGWWVRVGQNQWISMTYTNLELPMSCHITPYQKTVTINYRKGYGIAMWQAVPTGRTVIAGKTLPTGSHWCTWWQAVTPTGRVLYNLGGNQWIEQQYVK
ncbi:hypothetical protein [Lacticaseibacillus saniviri]|uniref:hypothetical protein n=1 Tax=Lacticaseibacillus saniviri TaxID=931533 RepID=UPI001EDFCBCE|nr:hypothetical protein [Lacticaseibacillus saniviri]MCG4282398.1 hypothetical protein [Lacticaseibacillus saniviri]